MKKFKRIAALILAGAMVLGMSTTAFADGEKATITVNNAGSATLSYVQVIEPNTTTVTGWDIVDTYASCYTEALEVATEQDAIAKLIKYENADATFPASLGTVTAATAEQIDIALSNVLGIATFAPMTNGMEVSEAGVYAIKATEVGYTYKMMAAYVGFGEVAGTYPALLDASVTAKKAPTTVTKADNDADNAVAIDQVIRYTVTTAFPYINANDTGKYFAVSDTITGAEYINLDSTAKVTIGGEEVEATFVKNGNSFTVDLTAYINNGNTNANKEVVVSYDAIVTATTVENQASSHIGTVKYDSEKINLYTGKITLVKVDANNDTIKLADAEFAVTDEDGNAVTFVQKDATKSVYTYDAEGTVTTLVTDENGELVVEGLDIGTYTFTETKAPDGYSLNDVPVTATLAVTEKNADNEATAIFTASTSMADTKLVALPSTGGMGTTIFTVGGVAIIIAAAALLFARRRVAR